MVQQLEHLQESSLFQFLLEKASPILMDVIDKESIEVSWTRPLDIYEDYIIDSARAIVQVEGAFLQLQFCIAFISNFRATPATKRLEIDRFNYLIYHLENFYIRLVTIFDRMLILVDRIFQLGNHPRHSNWSVLSKNRHIKESPVQEPLKELKKFIEPYQHPRNLIVHQRGYQTEDETLDRLSIFYAVARLESESPPEQFIKRATDEAIAEKVSELTPLVEVVKGHLFAVFDSLLPELQRRSKYLREMSNH